MNTQVFRLRRWQTVLLGLLTPLVVICLLFDWDWLRHPLERYVTRTTHREFRISNLDVDLGWTPAIKMKDVVFGNAGWSSQASPMAQVQSLEFTVSLRDLLDHKILVPRVALSHADFLFEKAVDGRKNWLIQDSSQSTGASTFRISSISVNQGHLRYINHGEPMTVDIEANTFDPEVAPTVNHADAALHNTSYTTLYSFSGKYHEASFSGEALTGDVLSFQESGITFPIKGKLNAGTTRALVEGTIADVMNISAIDVQLQIKGSTLANLYPFLLLPLPASPPYEFRGHLVQKGDRYGIDDLSGKIGATDIRGSGDYLRREPRPLLTARLESTLLKLSDLGPIIGLETKETAAKAGVSVNPTQADTNTREQAQTKERQSGGDKVLPAGRLAAMGDGILPRGKFDGRRISAIDADVDFAAAKLDAPTALPLESMKFSFHLHDAVAKLTPLQFGFAGGNIVSNITIDARQEKLLHSTIDTDFRHIQVAKLFPAMPKLAKGAGELGAQIRLKGTGASIADAAGTANGSLAVAIANGQVSNLVDALAGLNGGKIIALMVGGDKDIAVRCGGAAFRVRDGIGKSQLFVVDTEQTRVDGTGTFNLKDEQFNFTVTPKPKKPGILSLRTPLNLYGSFRHPQYGLDRGKLVLRVGSALALGLISPFAAILPLIETGSGTDSDCAQILAPVQDAQRQASSTKTGPATAIDPVTSKSPRERAP
jgi:uncharacterized protein involved in outer membrane biogenesis